ncbi:MAG: glycosyltransferase family 2 protein [Desulfuromonadaceae bacterium]
MKRVYIVILNWNGWQDTIECLESVFRLDYPNFRVIVCDNDSMDGSVERIKAWAEGNQTAIVPESHSLYALSHPPVAKPIVVDEYDRRTAEAGGVANDVARLVLIRTGANLGFAGGNNVGLRHALSRGDFDYVWLLNNDTVVRSDALSWMVKRMEERPDAGMCGSLMPYYDVPDMVWTAGGGTFNQWLAKSCSLDDRVPIAEITPRSEIEKQMDYVAGASLLISKPYLHKIGLMSEDYFLYFEEPDWYFRGRKHFSLAYSENSIVYHKVGISTSRYDEGKDRNAEYYCFRNQLRITKKFLPIALPLVFLRVLINRLKSSYRRTKHSLSETL